MGRTVSRDCAVVRALAYSASYVGCFWCWFSSLLRKVFLRVLRSSTLFKNQHFLIPLRSGKCPQLVLGAKYISNLKKWFICLFVYFCIYYVAQQNTINNLWTNSYFMQGLTSSISFQVPHASSQFLLDVRIAKIKTQGHQRNAKPQMLTVVLTIPYENATRHCLDNTYTEEGDIQ